ncbi:MAG TPA: alkaline phosphatase family protein [Candidatus Sulfotelmatobacter sp.]|nr:alkaline phosphatase family protein [Candidatus Sulfotelmatobacter sp.]
MNRLFQHERRICIVAAIALAVPFFLRFPLIHAQSKKAHNKKDRVVVVISLDGFPAYALKDPRLPIPTLRKLAREGAIAESMQPVNPTVTWPNHTTIVTGVDASQHHVVFNGLLEHPEKEGAPKIEPWRDKDILVHSPTIYDVAHEASLTTAQVDWVAIYNAKTIDWKFPELPEVGGEIEQKLIADGTVTADQLKTFENSSQAWQDEIWTDAAVRILEDHHPNLLLFHLLTLDDINHEYGPMSNASLTAMAWLDSQVNRVVQVLQRPDFAGRSTLIIVSDHGFRSYRHRIHAHVLMEEKGFITGADGKLRGDAWVVPEGGSAMVYVTNAARRAELILRLKSMYAGAEGIEKVYGVEDFGSLGLPTPAESDQGPDLVLAAKPDYAFSGDSAKSYITEAAGGTHGFLNSDPQMQAIFLAWGQGVPRNSHLGAITNREVAPTIAKLLGLELKSAKSGALPNFGN